MNAQNLSQTKLSATALIEAGAVAIHGATDTPAAPRQQTKAEARAELQQAIRGSNQLLASATTLVPLFPDTISIDRAKLTVTKRTFFNTADVMSIRIEDILNVTVSVGIIFGAIKIFSRIPTAQPYEINLLKRGEALQFKRIAQGYVIALKNNIDCSKFSRDELVTMLEKLGEDDHAGSDA